jgi:hypothetical protein
MQIGGIKKRKLGQIPDFLAEAVDPKTLSGFRFKRRKLFDSFAMLRDD